MVQSIMQTTQPTWILQSDFEDEYSKKIKSILKHKKIPFKEIKYYDIQYLPGMFGFFYGSIRFCRRVNKFPIYPGVFNLDELKCSNYYPKLSDYLFNYRCVYTTYSEFKKNKYWFIDTIGDGYKIFIRPNTNDKIFDGCVIDEYTDLQRLTCETIPDNQMLVLSKYKKIDEEYRFVYINGKFITGSQYKKDGKLFEKEIFEDFEYTICLDTISDRFPKLCVVDIGVKHSKYKDGSGYGILEIGAINCAGFYSCNLEKIIDSVNEYLIKTEEEWHNDNNY